MRTRPGSIPTVLTIAAIFAGAATGAACGGGGDDDADPSTFRLLGNMSAVVGAATQSGAAKPSLWDRVTNVVVRPAMAQSACSAATLEVCLESTSPGGELVEECSPVDPGSCSFDVSLALFGETRLFVRDVSSGRVAPFWSDVEPLQNGCRLLLCNVDLDFDRQVAFPAASLNSCAEPAVPFDCTFLLSRTPTPGPRRGGAADDPGPTPTARPTLTPLPSVTPFPTETPVPPTATPTATPTETPQE